MREELTYTIKPSELNINALYDFLVHHCKFYDVVILALMLNQSKELIAELKESEKNNNVCESK